MTFTDEQLKALRPAIAAMVDVLTAFLALPNEVQSDIIASANRERRKRHGDLCATTYGMECDDMPGCMHPTGNVECRTCSDLGITPVTGNGGDGYDRCPDCGHADR